MNVSDFLAHLLRNEMHYFPYKLMHLVLVPIIVQQLNIYEEKHIKKCDLISQ